MTTKEVLFGMIPEGTVVFFSGCSVADTVAGANPGRWVDSVQLGHAHSSRVIFNSFPPNLISNIHIIANSQTTLTINWAGANQNRVTIASPQVEASADELMIPPSRERAHKSHNTGQLAGSLVLEKHRFPVAGGMYWRCIADISNPT